MKWPKKAFEALFAFISDRIIICPHPQDPLITEIYFNSQGKKREIDSLQRTQKKCVAACEFILCVSAHMEV